MAWLFLLVGLGLEQSIFYLEFNGIDWCSRINYKNFILREIFCFKNVQYE